MHTGHIWVLAHTHHVQHVHKHLFGKPVGGSSGDVESDMLIIWIPHAQVHVQRRLGRGDLQRGRHFCLCEWARCALLCLILTPQQCI